MKTENCAQSLSQLVFGLALISTLYACATPTLNSAAIPENINDDLVKGLPPTQDFCRISNTDEYACAQSIELPTGFSKASNQDLGSLKQAVKMSGKGGLCCAVVAVADSDVPIFRAWAPHYDDTTPQPLNYSPTFQFGKWWSPATPPRSRSQYRHEDDVCAAWNSLVVYSECNIKPDTQVVIGRGQSAQCDDNDYLPESSVLQIFFPGGAKDFTGQCTTYVWPGTP